MTRTNPGGRSARAARRRTPPPGWGAARSPSVLGRQIGARVAQAHAPSVLVARLQLIDRGGAYREGRGDEVIQQHAEAVEVRALARRRAAEDLRRQIERRAGEIARQSRAGAVHLAP